MKSIVLLSFMCFSINIKAQDIEEHIFLGALTVKGASPYSYRIQFRDSANIIKGFSVTDMNGPDQTKTAIKGVIDPKRKEFSFQETYIINTRSRTNRDSFCYIRAKLKLKERKGTDILSGSFTGYMRDGRTSCGSGEITLVSKSDILKKLMDAGPKADTIIKLMEKAEAATEDYKEEEKEEHSQFSLVPGSVRTLNCNKGNATIEVWDNTKIDGDVITLMHNDKILLDHHKVMADKMRFTIPLSDAEEHIKLIAESEGSEPPTTVRMICTCGKKTFVIDANSAIGKPTEIILK